MFFIGQTDPHSSIIIVLQDDNMAVHSPHRAPHPLVPGTLSATVSPLHQGWGYAVWHCAAGGQPEVLSDAVYCSFVILEEFH